MADNFVEKREFYRVAYEKPLKFKEFVTARRGRPSAAVSKNVSSSGILFVSRSLPKISSIIWINLPISELSICKEIEGRVVTEKSGILGRVVRVEEDARAKRYSVGVCFVKKGETT